MTPPAADIYIFEISDGEEISAIIMKLDWRNLAGAKHLTPLPYDPTGDGTTFTFFEHFNILRLLGELAAKRCVSEQYL